MVLLVVDAQKLITNEKLYNFHEFVANVEKLIDIARKNSIEVIYVRHDDGADSELTKGKNGFEICEKFKPCNGEKIFDKKAYANTTVDNSFMSAEQSYKYYNEFMWNGRYAECISLDETLKRMK